MELHQNECQSMTFPKKKKRKPQIMADKYGFYGTAHEKCVRSQNQKHWNIVYNLNAHRNSTENGSRL